MMELAFNGKAYLLGALQVIADMEPGADGNGNPSHTLALVRAIAKAAIEHDARLVAGDAHVR